MMADQPFRFLDLPAELRVMVYKFIPIITRHHTFRTPALEPLQSQGTVTLVTKSLAGSVLATCRMIHHEASYILVPKLGKFRAEPVRLIIDSAAIDFCKDDLGLLALIPARAAYLVSMQSSSTTPISDTNTTKPITTEELALTSFIDRCASALVGASSPGASSHARGLALTLPAEVEGLYVLFALRTLCLVMPRSPQSYRAVPSYMIMRRPTDGSVHAKGRYENLQAVLHNLHNPVVWQDQEQWAVEWEEGEAL